MVYSIIWPSCVCIIYPIVARKKRLWWFFQTRLFTSYRSFISMVSRQLRVSQNLSDQTSFLVWDGGFLLRRNCQHDCLVYRSHQVVFLRHLLSAKKTHFLNDIANCAQQIYKTKNHEVKKFISNCVHPVTAKGLYIIYQRFKFVFANTRWMKYI